MVELGEREWCRWWGQLKLYLSALPADEKQQHQEETDGSGAADDHQHPNTQLGFCGETQAAGSSSRRRTLKLQCVTFGLVFFELIKA